MSANETNDSHLKKQRQARELLDYCCMELRGLAKAFRRLGHHEVDSELQELADEISTANNLYDQACNEAFDRWFKDTQAASVNMISAALAVATLKSEG